MNSSCDLNVSSEQDWNDKTPQFCEGLSLTDRVMFWGSKIACVYKFWWKTQKVNSQKNKANFKEKKK